MFQIIDDVIPKPYQDELENILFNREFIEITKPVSESPVDGVIGHVHWLYRNNIKNEYFYLIENLFEEICKKSGYKKDNLYCARTFLQEQSNLETYSYIPYLHIDLIIPHVVFLYYVTDADGETLLVNKKYESGNPQYIEPNMDWEVLKAVHPKKGRVLIFDGAYYHTSGISKKGVRCAINFNVLVD